MNRDIKGIQRLIRAVELSNVRLVGAALETRISGDQEPPKMRVTLEHATKVQRSDDASRFLVIASIDVKALPDAGTPQDDALLSIRADFELAYQVPSGLEVSDVQLATFARINGVFNAWPYWREFVQSTTARMNLPPLILPVFRLPVSAEARKGAGGQKRSDPESREPRTKVH